MVPAGVIRRQRTAGFKPQVYRVVELAQEIVPPVACLWIRLGYSPPQCRTLCFRNWGRAVAWGMEGRRGPQDSGDRTIRGILAENQ
jgi:hypothetical protein